MQHYREIQYELGNTKLGFQIKESSQRRQWFKLDLDPSQNRGLFSLARPFPDPRAAPPGCGSTSEKLVTDYLTALRKHAGLVLSHKIPESALKAIPIEYILTVPAVWSDAAQAKTRACAEKAGMGRGQELHMISEPEAAALYALDAMDPHNLHIGDTFVLCDAGGGTVDLISYRISELKPVLKLEEAAPGSGSLCGSTFLNRIFEKFLREKLGEEDGWDEEVLEEVNRSDGALFIYGKLTYCRQQNDSSWRYFQILEPKMLTVDSKYNGAIDQEGVQRPCWGRFQSPRRVPISFNLIWN